METRLIQTLEAVVNTLNLVDVRGKENLDRQLGSIMAIERCLGWLREAKQEAAEAVEVKADEN